MKISAPVFLLALLLLSFTSCQTSREFRQPTSGWETFQGQLRYKGDEKSIIGEVVVRTGADDNLEAEFLSGPGFPLMRVRSDATNGRAEGVIARGRWSGEVKKAPTAFVGWFILYDVFEKTSGKSGLIEGVGWKATVERSGGKLTRLEVRIASSGEVFTFHFGA